MYRHMKISALIPAAGCGSRMGTTLKKQYLTLNGKEILNWTLENILSQDCIDEVVIIVPKEDVAEVELKVKSWFALASIHTPYKVVSGGETRQASVYQGLLALDAHSDYVLIHDGVRPFVPHHQICDFLDLIMDDVTLDGIVAGVQVTDTLKRTNDTSIIIETIDRTHVWAVQTPQVFEFHLLKSAHEFATSKSLNVTDDAALIEVLGKKTRIVHSDAENIKITRPFDLIIAEAIFKSYYNKPIEK